MRIRVFPLAVLLLLVCLSVRLPAQFLSRKARLSTPPPVPSAATLPSATAQPKVQPPVRLKEPSSQADKLDYFAGVWTERGEWQACVISGAGFFETQYDNRWKNDRLSSSWSWEGQHGQEDLRFDSKEGVYKWHDDGTPGKEDWKGTLKRRTWTWTGTATKLSDGRTVKGRYTEQEGSPTEYSFWYEISVKGGPWTRVMQGSAYKIRR